MFCGALGSLILALFGVDLCLCQRFSPGGSRSSGEKFKGDEMTLLARPH
jgi:hypothetical protein